MMIEAPPAKIGGGFLLLRGPQGNRKVGPRIWLKEQ